MYPRNSASPPRLAIGAVVQISDGAVQGSGVSIKVRPEGGSASAGGGTTAYEEGIVLYTPTQAETNYTAFVVIAYKTDCVPVSLAVVTTASATAGKVDVGAFGGTSVTGRDIGASVLLSSGTGTGQVSLSSGAVTAGTISSGAITASAIATGAITNAKFAAGAIDASAIASNAFAAAKFASDFFTALITAVWTTASTRVLTAATNLTTALATPTNITAGTITTVSGNVTGSVGSIATGGITAASFAADALARLGIIAAGTAQGATGTTLQLASAAAFADDELIGAVVVITGGTTGVGQSRVITDYVGSTDTATVDAWTTTPTGTITYVVFAAPPASATAIPAVNVTQFGGSAGTFSGGRPEVNTTHAAGTAWGSGAITAASIASDAITAAKVAADVTTEIQSGLATASALSTVAGYLDTEVAAILAAVDTEVAAIKAKTDNLPAAPAATGDIPSASTVAAAVLSAADSAPIAANVQEINDVTIIGDGDGSPFDVA